MKVTVLATTLIWLYSSQAYANSEVERLSENPANWVTWGGNYAAQRYSQLNQINPDNAKNLRLDWSFSTGVLRGHQGGPLVIGDIAYIHTPFPNTVYALSLKTHSVLWEFTPQQDAEVTIPVMCCDTVSKGLAYGDGKIFVQQNDTILTALDAKTGKRIWSVQNGDPKLGMSNTNAPLVVKDQVITGIQGHQFGIRAFLAAYDIKTGQMRWKGYNMGPDKDMLIDPVASKTWRDGKLQSVGKGSGLDEWSVDNWKISAGDTVGWYSYDPELNLIYYGTGQPNAIRLSSRIITGHSWSAALWARDANTGQVKWVYQTQPHRSGEFSATNESLLIDQTINGQLRKTLVQFNQNGMAFTLDRATGELLQEQPYASEGHIDLSGHRPPEGLDYNALRGTYCPGHFGYKDQGPGAYSAQTSLFYVPVVQSCEIDPAQIGYPQHRNHEPLQVTPDPSLPRPPQPSGAVVAFDHQTGKNRWQKQEPFPVVSGVLTTAGGLVVYGTLDGYLKVLDAQSGAELYAFKTPSGIIGNINTWQYGGKQYLGVLSGIGGTLALNLSAGIDPSPWQQRLSEQTKLGGSFMVFALP